MNEDLTAIIRQKLKDIGRDCEFATKTTFLELKSNDNKIRRRLLLPANNSYYLLIGIEAFPLIMEIASHNFLYRKMKSEKSFRSMWEFPLLSGQVSLSYACESTEEYPHSICYLEITPITTQSITTQPITTPKTEKA